MRVMDPDALLMLRVKDGDRDAFNQLLDKYQRPIINFIYHFIHNRAEAEELAQDVFLKIYEVRGRYRAEAKFSTWLYKIATNFCLKKLSRGKSRTNLEVSIDGGQFLELQDRHPSVQEVLESQEREKIVAWAIGGLSKNERTAVVLRKYHSLSYKEIAYIMGCTEGAVKTYIHRAKLRLKERLVFYLGENHNARM